MRWGCSPIAPPFLPPTTITESFCLIYPHFTDAYNYGNRLVCPYSQFYYLNDFLNISLSSAL